MPKPLGVEREETERLHESEDPPIAEAQRRRPLGFDDDGVSEGVQVIVTDQAVVAQIFDAQEAPVGGKADLPQGGQIAERTTDHWHLIGAADVEIFADHFFEETAPP